LREKTILELKPESHLPLAPRLYLDNGAEWRRGIASCLDCRNILSIEHIEELKQRVDLHSFSDVESLGQPQIEIDEWRTRKRISSWSVIDGIKSSIAIGIFERNCRAAEMKSTLRPKDAAHLKLPRQLEQSIHLKSVGY